MKVTTKEIITQNPVKLEVDGRETSASITCTVRTTESGDCIVNYLDTKYSYEIPLEPLKCNDPERTSAGTIVVDTFTVEGQEEPVSVELSYEIKQKKYDCPSTDECTCKCTDVRTWTVPYYIDDDYPDDGEVKIYYEYWYTSAGTNTVCSREKRIGYSATTKGALPKDGNDYINPITGTIEQNCSECKYEAFVSSSSGCKSTPSSSLTVSFSTNPTEIPGTGGSVTVICNFKKVIIDDKCNKKTESGSFTSATTISPCNLDTEGLTCCVDHDVELKIPVSTILTKLGLPNATEVIYNGSPATGDLSFYITQRRRYDGICNGDCEYITTYCVDSGTVKVYYESLYGKGDWSTEGCLPLYGGRIKVTWAYTAITYTEVENPSCPSGETKSVYEDYMLIGDCRDPYHPDDYQVFFKEQTPGCTTCSGVTMTEGPLAGKKANTFMVKPCQNCEITCDCNAITRFDISVPGECDCGDFEFIEPTPPTDCNCDDFSFNDSPTDCNCDNFSFNDSPTPTDCNCDNFNFDDSPTPDCDCNKFNFKDEE